MDSLYDAHTLVARAGAASTDPNRPPAYKTVGIVLAIASGLFIGTSFVMKKVGLLKANEKYNEVAGDGYGYLKNGYWWGGMTLMIVGEICNFVAYAFVDAILVTPLGALSVVVTTILSAIFLKERLSFVGKLGCFNCIIGTVVIVVNAPEQSAVADIQQMQGFVIAPGFLTYAGVVILGSIFTAWWAGPRYGKKSMMVYLTICSMVGGLSVVATQGLGSAVVAQAGGKPQFNQWFLYVLLVFVIATLLTEIIYLNKALNLFNAALVTPTYYVFFTSSTIIASAILFRGFKGTPIQIITVIMGFFQICTGVVLLQLSKSSKDVPDAAVFKGDLDQIREVAQQEQPETDPKADAIRGTAALVRRFSSARQKMEEREFERLHQEKMQEQLEPLRENEIAEWDGIRRRKTVIGDHPGSPMVRRLTVHPPLGMSQFPHEMDEESGARSPSTGGVLASFRDRASTVLHLSRHASPSPNRSTIRPVALEDIEDHAAKSDVHVSEDKAPAEHTFGLPAALRRTSKSRGLLSPRLKPLPPHPEPPSSDTMMSPPNSARRTFSFINLLTRNKTPANAAQDDEPTLPPSRSGLASRASHQSRNQKGDESTVTEEERMGLVKGDSTRSLFDSSPERPPTWQPILIPSSSAYHHHASSHSSRSSTSTLNEKDGAHDRDMPSDRYQYVHARSESDTDWQVTRPNDSTTTDRRGITAPTVRATETTRTTRTGRSARRSSSEERRFAAATTPSHRLPQPRPPPAYQQIYAQSPPRALLSRTQVPDLVPHHALWPDRATAHASTPAGPEWVQVSARPAPAFDPSRNSSTSPSRTTHRRSTSRFNRETDLRRSDDGTRQRSAIDDADLESGTDIDDDVDYRPHTIYAQQVSPQPQHVTNASAGSPTSSRQVTWTQSSEPVSDRAQVASPALHDPDSAETKEKFQEQSQRERAQRRMRMSSSNNAVPTLQSLGGGHGPERSRP